MGSQSVSVAFRRNLAAWLDSLQTGQAGQLRSRLRIGAEKSLTWKIATGRNRSSVTAYCLLMGDAANSK